MKVLPFFFFGLLICPITTRSQSLITVGNLPGIGTTTVQKTFAVHSIQPGGEGMNQTWDFSGLQIPAEAPNVSLSFVSPAQTPHHAEFPGANLASQYQSLDGIFSYGYFKTSGTQFMLLGTATNEGKEGYDRPNLLATLPMSFGQQAESAYNGTATYSSFSSFIAATKTMRYDGFGTLKLPAKTWQNAMRTKTVENRVDSVAFDNGGYTKNSIRSSLYAWFVTGIANPLFEIRIVETVSYTYIPGVPPLTQVLPVQRIVNIQTHPTTPVYAPNAQPASFAMRMISANPLQERIARVELNSTRKNTLRVFVVNALGQVLSVNTVDINAETQIMEFDLAAFGAGVYHMNFTDGTTRIPLSVVCQ